MVKLPFWKMPPVLLCAFTFLAFFTITEQTSKSLKELEQILKNLASQAAPKNQVKNYRYLPNYLRPQPQERSNRYESNPSLEDIESSEIYYQLKGNKIQKQLEDDLQQALRFESERICKATGRCGCFEGRCSNPYNTVNRAVDDIEHLLKELNKDSSIEYEDKKNGHKRQESGYHRKQYNGKQGQHVYKTLDYGEREQKQSHKRQDYEDRRQIQHDKNEEQEDRTQEYQERIQSSASENDEFDIVILDLPQINEFQNIADDAKIIDITKTDLRNLLQHQKNLYNRNEKKEQYVDVVNPEKFVKYFEIIKKEITDSLSEYSKGQGDNSYLSHLLPIQNKLIKQLDDIESNISVKDKELSPKIIKLLLDTLKNIKSVLQLKDDETISVPQRVHNKRNDLSRSNKRLFPLTFFQKQRQRNLSPKNIILKHSWRRNNPQTPNYGVPFNLQVQGLGQIN